MIPRVVIVAAIFNSLYSFVWDVRMDWGLGQAGAKRWGLRNTLLVSRNAAWPYYAAIALDLVLRLAWVAKLMEKGLARTDLVLTLELVEVSA